MAAADLSLTLQGKPDSGNYAKRGLSHLRPGGTVSFMENTDDTGRKPRQRWAKGQPRPRYLQPEDIDKMMLMFVALMSEVSALRDRLDTHEAVAELGGQPSTAAIEAYELSPERHLQRAANRHAMLTRVLRAITEERDEAIAGAAA